MISIGFARLQSVTWHSVTFPLLTNSTLSTIHSNLSPATYTPWKDLKPLSKWCYWIKCKNVSDALVRKRKLTEKGIPNVILQNPNFAQDSQMYQDLLDMERKLDWNMMRKRVEVQDALSRTPTVRLARIYLLRGARLILCNARLHEPCVSSSTIRLQINSGRQEQRRRQRQTLRLAKEYLRGRSG